LVGERDDPMIGGVVDFGRGDPAEQIADEF
jgi:hypothetical protein